MIRLPSQADFDLKKIAESGQCFRLMPAQPPRETELFSLLHSMETTMETYRLPVKDRVLFLGQDGEGRVYMDCSDEDFEEIWSPYFDLDRDYRAIREGVDFKKDPFLGQALESGKGIRILRQEPWECLVTFIISQRKNIPAIQKAVEALAQEGGDLLAFDGEGRPIYRFPGPREVHAFSEDSFMRIRLGYREKYIRRLAADLAQAPGILETYRDLSDPDLMDRLLSFYGVGIKIASCVALFAYGRLDLAPIDVWMERVSRDYYGGEMDLAAYSPHAGLIQQYLFYHIRLIQGALPRQEERQDGRSD